LGIKREAKDLENEVNKLKKEAKTLKEKSHRNFSKNSWRLQLLYWKKKKRRKIPAKNAPIARKKNSFKDTIARS